MMDAYNHTLPRIISSIYEVLMCCSPSSTLYIKLKWDKELKTEIPETDWYDMWIIHQSTTSSLIWREFSWKCLIRFFITPTIKSKQVSRQQVCWRQCGQLEADHAHIFWSCEKIQSFWDDVQVVMSEVLGYRIPRTSYIKGIVPKRDQYLCKILLVACKKTITRNWLKDSTLNCKQWFEIIEEILVMEELTYTLKMKKSAFRMDWKSGWYIKKIKISSAK